MCLGEEIVDRLPVLRDLTTSLKKQDQPWKTNGNNTRGDWGGIEQLIDHCVTGSPGRKQRKNHSLQTYMIAFGSFFVFFS